MASSIAHIRAARNEAAEVVERLSPDRLRDDDKVSQVDLAEALKASRHCAEQLVEAQFARHAEAAEADRDDRRKYGR